MAVAWVFPLTPELPSALHGRGRAGTRRNCACWHGRQMCRGQNHVPTPGEENVSRMSPGRKVWTRSTGGCLAVAVFEVAFLCRLLLRDVHPPGW